MRRKKLLKVQPKTINNSNKNGKMIKIKKQKFS